MRAIVHRLETKLAEAAGGITQLAGLGIGAKPGVRRLMNREFVEDGAIATGEDLDPERAGDVEAQQAHTDRDQQGAVP